MTDIDETAVLSHAKALAAQDGLTWEIDFNAPREGRASFRGMHFLSEGRRQKYLTCARAELREESSGSPA